MCEQLCPLQEKQECWWLYMTDKRGKDMVTMPQRITGLKDEHTVRKVACCDRVDV